MPRAIAVLHETLKSPALSAEERLKLLLSFDAVLALGMDSWQAEEIQIPAAVTELVAKREAARKARDFRLADELRVEITQLGFVLEDSKEGAKVRPA